MLQKPPSPRTEDVGKKSCPLGEVSACHWVDPDLEELRRCTLTACTALLQALSIPISFLHLLLLLCLSLSVGFGLNQVSVHLLLLITGPSSFGWSISADACPTPTRFLLPLPPLLLPDLSPGPPDLVGSQPSLFHRFRSRCFAHQGSHTIFHWGRVFILLIGSAFEKQLKNRLPTQINDSETVHGRRCYYSDNPSLNVLCRKDGKHSCLIIPHDQMSREGQQAGARIPRRA